MPLTHLGYLSIITDHVSNTEQQNSEVKTQTPIYGITDDHFRKLLKADFPQVSHKPTVYQRGDKRYCHRPPYSTLIARNIPSRANSRQIFYLIRSALQFSKYRIESRLCKNKQLFTQFRQIRCFMILLLKQQRLLLPTKIRTVLIFLVRLMLLRPLCLRST